MTRLGAFEAGGSITSLPASSSSLGPPLSGLLVLFCSPWHSFPVESRSGPPSPDVSEISISVPLIPMGVNISGTVEEAEWVQTHPSNLTVYSHQRQKVGPKNRYRSQPDNVPIDRGRRCGEELPIGKEHTSMDYGQLRTVRVTVDAHRKVGVLAGPAIFDIIWSMNYRKEMRQT